MKTQYKKNNQTAEHLRKGRTLVVIGFSIASDWLRELCKFLVPITEQSKWKQMQSLITFNTQLKIALFTYP